MERRCIVALAVCAAASASVVFPEASSGQALSITLSLGEAQCLLAHEADYREIDIDPVILVPSVCPDDIDEIPWGVLTINSHGANEGSSVLIISKTELECLFRELHASFLSDQQISIQISC